MQRKCGKHFVKNYKPYNIQFFETYKLLANCLYRFRIKQSMQEAIIEITIIIYNYLENKTPSIEFLDLAKASDSRS